MVKCISLFTLVILAGCTKPAPESTSPVLDGSITNLYDAFGKDSSLTKDFGFACITRYHGKNILFDAGSNADIFKANLTRLRFDLSAIDIVVVSHAHFDHINGLDYLLQVNPHLKIYFPNDIFWGAPVPYDATGQEPQVRDSLPAHMQYFGGADTKFLINQSGRFWNANIEFVKSSVEILPGLRLIATSSPFLGYFSCYPGKSFVEGQFSEGNENCRNTNLPELSVSMKTRNGEVLLVGCSHTGVEGIVKNTMEATKSRIDLVYGGFHMIPFNRAQTVDLVNMLKDELGVRRVAPAHCTGHLAFKILQDAFGDNYIYAGLGETIIY